MNKKQAEQKGYGFTGVFSSNKEEVKVRIVEEKKKGNKAVLVNVPPSPYSRGYHGMGYSMYIIKNEENIKAEKIKNLENEISNIKHRLGIKREEMVNLDTELLMKQVALSIIK